MSANRLADAVGSLNTARDSGVSIRPGLTVLMRTPLPSAANSNAAALPNMRAAPFAALYDPDPGPEIMPRIDATLTIAPDPDATSIGSIARVPRNSASTLTARISRHSARLVSASIRK